METLVDARIASDKQDMHHVRNIPYTQLRSVPQGGAGGAAEQFYMIPGIPLVGTGVAAENYNTACRTGNRIKLKSCTFSGLLMFDNVMQITNVNQNMFLRCMLISDKENPQQADSADAWQQITTPSANILYRENDAGPSVVFAASAQYTNWCSPINHQRFTVHDEKRIKLTTSRGTTQTTDGNTIFTYPANATIKKLTLSMKCKSRYLQYERETAVQPRGVAPFFVFHIVDARGNPIPNGSVGITGKIRTTWENLA